MNEDVAELLRENTELQKIVGQLNGRMRAMNSHEVGYLFPAGAGVIRYVPRFYEKSKIK